MINIYTAIKSIIKNTIMKRFSLFLILLTSFIVASCGDDDDVVAPGNVDKTNIVNVNLSASIEASSQKVINGDKIKLSLKDVRGLESLDKNEYKDKAEYSMEIEYFVDGKSVGTSSDRANGFVIEYQVANLEQGEHTVTATSKTGKSLIIKDDIRNCKFTVEEKTVSISLTYNGHVSRELSEFVTPVLSYTDAEGEHTVKITSDIWNEESFTLSDGREFFVCRWKDKKIEIKAVPTRICNLTFRFVQKDGGKVNAEKEYYIGNGFSITGYSYAYNGVHIGNITDIKIDLDLTGGNKNLVEGSKMAEYVNQLCGTTYSYNMLLQEDGKLEINKLEK